MYMIIRFMKKQETILDKMIKDGEYIQDKEPMSLYL